eukprot:scaffold376024_cov16-Prasinocladus_malaysianus.AAC.1
MTTAVAGTEGALAGGTRAAGEEAAGAAAASPATAGRRWQPMVEKHAAQRVTDASLAIYTKKTLKIESNELHPERIAVDGLCLAVECKLPVSINSVEVIIVS